MPTAPPEPGRVDVFYDGECGLCRATRDWAGRRDASEVLCFVDFRQATDADLPVERELLEAEMWVRRPDGSLASGSEAVGVILRTVPHWRWVGRLLSAPLLRRLAAPAYRAIARHRRRV